jgi:hypothetical protein
MFCWTSEKFIEWFLVYRWEASHSYKGIAGSRGTSVQSMRNAGSLKTGGCRPGVLWVLSLVQAWSRAPLSGIYGSSEYIFLSSCVGESWNGIYPQMCWGTCWWTSDLWTQSSDKPIHINERISIHRSSETLSWVFDSK